MTIEKASQWVRQLGIIPVFLPHSAIVDADGDRLEYLLGQDPLLCMQLFRVFAREENRPVTAAELIKNLNHTAIIAYSQQLPRQSTGNDGNHQLMSALADSWLANSFLRSWHNVRKVSWTEEDHWTCLFSDVPEWLVAYNDPMLLEGIVYRIQNGELRDQVFTEIFGFDYSELYQAAVINFGLPSVDRLGGNQGHQPFKYQALKYYLPISNQLATLCRQSPDNLDQGNLIAKAETATLIDDFRQQLPVWLASSARHSIWSFCHQAILGYFNTQPDLYKYDQMRARQSVPPTLSVESVQQSVEPEAELSVSVKSTAPKSIVVGSAPGADNKDGAKPNDQRVEKSPLLSAVIRPEHDRYEPRPVPAKPPPLTESGLGLNRQVVEEIIFLLEKQKARYRNEELAFAALMEAMEHGLGMTAMLIAVYKPSSGLFRVQYRQGTIERKSIHDLAEPIPDYGIIAKLAQKPTSFWLNEENVAQAVEQLPENFRQIATTRGFFMRSIFLNQKLKALVYADAANAQETLSAEQYQWFRKLTAQVEKAINN